MKNFLIALVACCILPSFFTSCAKEEVVSVPTEEAKAETAKEEISQGFRLSNTEAITTAHDLFQKFKAHERFSQLEVELLDWETMTLASYEDTDMQSILVPFHDSKKVLTIIYKEEKFNSMIIEIASSIPVTSPDQAFTGTVSLYAIDGSKLVSSHYQEDSFVELERFNSSRETYWECFQDCALTNWEYMPEWIKTTCNASFSACVFSGNIYACGMLAGCAAGHLSACLFACGWLHYS